MYIVTAPPNGTLHQFLPSARNFMGPVIDPTLAPAMVADASSRILYIPARDFNGSDSFIFRARPDINNAESSNQTASILVSPVPDPPLAQSAVIMIEEDVSQIVNFTISDPDTSLDSISVILTYIPPMDKGSVFELDDSFTPTTVISVVPHRISGNRKKVLYVPPKDQFGDVFTSFRFLADDFGNISPAEGIVSVSITSINDPPVSFNSTVVGDEDTDIPFQFGCSDADVVDLSKLMVTIKSIPPLLAGTLRRADQTRLELRIDDRVNGTAFFSPRPNYYGNFTIGFTCSDAALQSAISFVHIFVRNLNDPPNAEDMLIVGMEDQDVEITINPVDIDTDAGYLTVVISTLPVKGVLFAALDRMDEANLTMVQLTVGMLPISLPFGRRAVFFRPSTNAFGSPYAMFTYQIDDGSTLSLPATITVQIISVNDPPFFNLSSLTLDVMEDTPATFTFDIQDIDPGDRLIVKVTNIRVNGSLFQVRSSAPFGSSSALGEGSDNTGPPFQIQFVPNRDFFSSNGTDQALNITYSDSVGIVTYTEEIKFAVNAVNDLPKIKCDEPNIPLPADFLTGEIWQFNFRIDVEDADDQDFKIQSVTTPAKGLVYDS
ncbi:hypothetical protein BKA69DRAFT_464322 [Paraphysoderma sedebokerense]|nr:hypothetical protein BKA69DRAFT_464322 [Paraphysoderma sedebokerense]